MCGTHSFWKNIIYIIQQEHLFFLQKQISQNIFIYFSAEKKVLLKTVSFCEIDWQQLLQLFVVPAGLQCEPGGSAFLLQERQTPVQEARSRHQCVDDQKEGHLLLWPSPRATPPAMEKRTRVDDDNFVCADALYAKYIVFSSFCALLLLIKTTLPDDPASKQKQKQVIVLLLLSAIQPTVLCSFHF